MSNDIYRFEITEDNPEYIMVKLTDYNKLIHQNEKIDEILKELELIKLRLSME